jgi:hypothetical protein
MLRSLHALGVCCGDSAQASPRGALCVVCGGRDVEQGLLAFGGGGGPWGDNCVRAWRQRQQSSFPRALAWRTATAQLRASNPSDQGGDIPSLVGFSVDDAPAADRVGSELMAGQRRPLQAMRGQLVWWAKGEPAKGSGGGDGGGGGRGRGTVTLDLVGVGGS